MRGHPDSATASAFPLSLSGSARRWPSIAKAGQCLHNSGEPALRRREAGPRRGGLQNAKRQPKLPFVLIRGPEPSRRRFLAGITLAELLDATCSVDDFLLARIERVACRAHFNVQRLVDRRARRKSVAAAARHLDLAVLRMDTGFHQAPVRWAGRGPVAPTAPRCILLTTFNGLADNRPAEPENYARVCAALQHHDT